MSLPAAEQAYWIGLLPRLIGVTWEATLLLDEVRTGAAEELAARIVKLEGALSDAKEQRQQLAELERALGQCRLGPLDRPARADGYAAWAETLAARVMGEVQRATRAEAKDEERLQGYRAAWAHRLGSTVGEMLHVMRLGVIVNHLRDVAPEHAFLFAHARTLGEAQRQALHGVERLFHGLHKLGEPAEAVGQLLLDLLKAPNIDGSDHPRATSMALQAVAKAIDLPGLAREAGRLLAQYEA